MSEKNQDSDIAFIKALAEILENNELGEVEVKRDKVNEDSLKVRLSRHLSNQSQVINMTSPQAVPPVTVNEYISNSNAPTADTPSSVNNLDPVNHPGAVNSPMVGTVYLQPEPGAAPFTSVGSK